MHLWYLTEDQWNDLTALAAQAGQTPEAYLSSWLASLHDQHLALVAKVPASTSNAPAPLDSTPASTTSTKTGAAQ
jgi:hypothetical protein